MPVPAALIVATTLPAFPAALLMASITWPIVVRSPDVDVEAGARLRVDAEVGRSGGVGAQTSAVAQAAQLILLVDRRAAACEEGGDACGVVGR